EQPEATTMTERAIGTLRPNAPRKQLPAFTMPSSLPSLGSVARDFARFVVRKSAAREEGCQRRRSQREESESDFEGVDTYQYRFDSSVAAVVDFYVPLLLTHVVGVKREKVCR